ncbi:MAG TPA: chemotaxis protein CheW, partial [Polyangiaceae bacterium]|nr:chemotaxis protein CheW [Polyangiaceae bacterium]
ELDKSLIESIKDPLTHLLRNSVDHGIEPPDERTRHGKHPEGRILVRAAHAGGQVCVEISDDGAGIDLERVRDKAVSQGLVLAERASRMSRDELINLIFLPGFSTAKAVTNVSGRGVGMDVVKTNVEHMGGTVEVETELGRGTTFRIRVPLTLAIMPALIVASGSERYAVPQASLQELVVVDVGRSRQRIERVHGAPVYRLRDKLLPLVFLSEQLATETREQNFLRAKAHIAVLFAGGRQFGLVVDQVSDQQEIVVKPLAAGLKSLNVYAGATIMGDGRVVLILDVVGLAQRASLATNAREEVAFSAPAESLDEEEALTSLLLLRGPDDARLAVPLARVARLHTPLAVEIEEAAGNQVLQYGDEIMPVVELAGLLPERRLRPRHDLADTKPPERLNLVVVSAGGTHIGIAVHEILDVVDVRINLKGPSRPGVVGTMVIHGRVTELLDLDRVIEQSGALSALAEAV